MQYFIYHDNQQLGPFSEAELKAKLASGAVLSSDQVWWQGQKGWVPLSQTQLVGPTEGTTAMAPSLPGSPAQGRTSGLAVASLVCGILGLGASLFTGIPAVIMGHMSLSRIRRDPTLRGHEMALAGTILGYLSIVVLPVISIIAISVLIALGNQVKGTFTTISSDQAVTDTSTNAPASGR